MSVMEEFRQGIMDRVEGSHWDEGTPWEIIVPRNDAPDIIVDVNTKPRNMTVRILGTVFEFSLNCTTIETTVITVTAFLNSLNFSRE